MFWGLIMEPGKKYSQTVQKSFHISHAALDMENATNDPVQVLLGFDNRNYLICTLQKGKWIQTNLDLNFQTGDKVSFATNGPGHVHLTGYLVPEDDFDLTGDEEVEEEESEEEVPQLVPAKKRKAMENNMESASKKSKTAKLLESVNEDDSDDSDDSDVNLSSMLEDDDGEEEASDEEDEDDEDDEDDDESDDEMEADSDEEEQKTLPLKEKTKTPVKENGVAKKQEKTPKANQTPGKDKQNMKTPQQNEKKEEKTPKQKTPGKENKEGQSPQQKKERKLEGGVSIEDLKVGDGPNVAKPGKLLQVYYEGRLKNNNKMFDSSNKGPGFKFRLGRHEVIKGWDVGIAGMKVGGKRRITCPPNMAYGSDGSPPVIPPNSTLVFEVELKNVKN